MAKMAMTTPPETAPRLGRSLRAKKALQVIVIVALIVAFGAGGALYYSRYGDRTTTSYRAIQEKTKELLKIEIPERLWPRMMITRPDVMTMVFYASKNDETCLAIMMCQPSWARERGNRPDRLLQATVEKYFPQFNTERWTGTEEREVPVRGAPLRVKLANSFRTEDHKEVRVVGLDSLPTENGVISLYYESSLHSSTEDEVDRLLKSLQ
jgi:hypothetical protein